MIAGVGIDMIEVSRVEEKICKNQGFREMVFSADEIAYCEKKTHKFEHYAARFAVKEAFLKAIGTGWINELNLAEIEIQHQENGKPHLAFLGKTATTIAAKGYAAIHVSLTHLKEMASAVVILER